MNANSTRFCLFFDLQQSIFEKFASSVVDPQTVAHQQGIQQIELVIREDAEALAAGNKMARFIDQRVSIKMTQLVSLLEPYRARIEAMLPRPAVHQSPATSIALSTPRHTSAPVSSSSSSAATASMTISIDGETPAPTGSRSRSSAVSDELELQKSARAMKEKFDATLRQKPAAVQALFSGAEMLFYPSKNGDPDQLTCPKCSAVLNAKQKHGTSLTYLRAQVTISCYLRVELTRILALLSQVHGIGTTFLCTSNRTLFIRLPVMKVQTCFSIVESTLL